MSTRRQILALAAAVVPLGLRVLAVTSAARYPELPDVPTVAEFYPGFEALTWAMMLAPQGTPASVVEKLNSLLNNVMNNDAAKQQLWAMGIDAPPGARPAAANAFVASERKMVVRVNALGTEWCEPDVRAFVRSRCPMPARSSFPRSIVRKMSQPPKRFCWPAMRRDGTPDCSHRRCDCEDWPSLIQSRRRPHHISHICWFDTRS
jgi:Tripartite tricarboxylate transporter family receptor